MSKTSEIESETIENVKSEIESETIENVKSEIESETIENVKSEIESETISELNKGWDKENIGVVNYWMEYLSYCCLIYHFYLFKLKRIENFWAWLIIVLSALSSTISLLQYNVSNKLETTVNVFITIFTLSTTLISAWMKKQNYVEHISELSKYSLKINKLKGDVNSVIREPIKNRISYEEFIKLYKDDIISYISVRPLISPNDWKETIYIISKYYPELAAYEYPWNKIPNYGTNVMETYKNIKYNGLWNKLKHFYFCKCKCICDESDEQTTIASRILKQDISFYNKLPNSDFDCKYYSCKMYDGDIFKYLKEDKRS
jgi:hypothetical protein